MKILQILPSLEVGGVERGVIDLARAMQGRPEKMVVISSGGKLVAELHKLGVPHYALPVNRKSLASLRLIPKIVDIIRQENISVVHARSRVPAWLAWFAARKAGVPLVTTCHGYYANHPLSHVMGWGKRVIVISRVIGRHMIDDFGVSPDRIQLIHRGIDLSEFQYRPKEAKKPSEIRRIVNIGRLSPIKGQMEFLQAVHHMRQQNSRLEVWLVGAEAKGKTKYTQRLQATIKQLGLSTCVKLLGTRRDVPELLAQADLLVLSTLVPEAFGRVIVEAGAVGTPVLSTRVGGVLDILEDGVNGRLVPPSDPRAMAAIMLEMLNDFETCRRYTEALHQKVVEQFGLEQMAAKTLDVYRDVIKQKKILVIKLGAMGDLILGTPSFRMIRHRFRTASISLLVDKRLSALVADCPHVNESIPIDRHKLSHPGYLLKLAKRLRKEGYDLSIDLQNNKWTHLLAFISGIPERYGFRRRPFGLLVNRHDRNIHKTESPVRNQFRILSKLGIQDLEEDLELWPQPEREAYVESLLKGEGEMNGKKLVGFAIGASPQWKTKRWPLENYRALGQRLAGQGCRMVLIGTSEDASAAQTLVQEHTQDYVNLIGKTTPLDLVSLVKRLDVLVTGDTAPLHVAAAMQTKFVTLFGPTDSKRHAPPGEGVVLETHHLPCRPCYKGECREKEELACLRRITVNEVYDAVRKQLHS